MRGQKDACTLGLIFGDKSWRSHTAFREAGQWQASRGGASAAKPSHVLLWHKVIDAAPSCHNCSCPAVLIAVNLCTLGPAKRRSSRSDAKRDA